MSDSDLEEHDHLYKYTLVRFVHKGRKRQIESIDVVPSKWLQFDYRKGKCVTKFMEGPYQAEDLELINQLTLNDAPAPEDWPTYTVELKGRAKTYSEALKKLKRLEVEEHVLSLESGESASELQKKMTRDVKRQKLLDESINMKNSLSSPQIDLKTSLVDNKETTGQPGRIDSPLQKECLTDHSQEVRKPTQSKKICSSKGIPKIPKTPVQAGTSVDSEEFDNSPKPSTSTASSSPLPSFPVSDNEDATLENNEPQTSAEELNVVTQQLVSAPVISLESIECKSDFEIAVVSQLIHLTNVVNGIKQQQEEINNFLIDKKVVSKSTSNLEKKYNLALPINTLQQFNELEDKLKTNNFLKNDVYVKLCSLVDKDNAVTRSYVRMLKAFVTKDVATHFTSVRVSTVNKDKIKFKPTELSKLIDVSITKSRSKLGLKTTPEELITALSNVLGNVNKWKN